MKKKNMVWRWLVLIGLCAWSVWLAYPLSEKLPLGIDLSGGYRFVIGVDYDEMKTAGGGEPTAEEIKQAQNQTLEVLRNRIDSAGTREAVVYKETGTGRIVFEIPGVGEDERKNLEDLIKRPAFLQFRLVHEDNDELVAELLAAETEIPGYRLVTIDERRYYQRDPDYEGLRGEAYREKVGNTAPVSTAYELMLQEERLENYGTVYRPFYVNRRELLTGTAIRSAHPDNDEYGRVQVALEMNSEGSKRFFNITRDYVAQGDKNPTDQGRRLAIVMDGTLYSAPQLNSVISGGNAVITGQFTYEEAAKLSAALNSGALKAPVKILMQQQVEPTLGKQSVQDGIRAAIYGLAAVVVFMFVYYMVAGVVVNLALVLDAVLLPLGMFLAAGLLGIFAPGGGSAMANINALPTLTLPGIAGLVLTIGMAVDANVLIFERIREEQKAGKRLVSSISAGFDKAFSTIFDANITTLLVAFILFTQGSGPIRGFAVMLTAGIVVSMYTALVFTRMGFDLIARTSLDKIKMLSILPDNLNINFLGKDKIALAASLLVLLGTAVNIGIQGEKVLGIDFTGGASMLYSLTPDDSKPEGEQVPQQKEIQEKLAAVGVGESVIQYQQQLEGGGEARSGRTLQVRVDEEFTEVTRETLLDNYGDSFDFELVQQEVIGPQVGEELRNRGIKAIVFALIGIVIYITLRFEFAFAMGTIVALAHDVLLTVGIYCLCGRQLSLPIVAALLTIVGYSANDTIVVFDRIREDLKLLKGKPYREVANISINQTLSRTLLTSLTTLFTIIMLLVFGGGAIADFALALFIGVLVGTYSSTFVATPVMLLWHKQDKAA